MGRLEHEPGMDGLNQSKSPLGQKIDSPTQYHPDILYRIDRQGAKGRGYDTWNCYELSCLLPSGKPLFLRGSFEVPVVSAYMVESKSLKLYLNSFNQHTCESKEDMAQMIQDDLSRLLEINIKWRWEIVSQEMPADLMDLDSLDLDVHVYEYDPRLLLRNSDQTGAWAVCMTAFRSLCPVTQQPDWATIYISAESARPDFKSLYRYLVSFRNHAGFHEKCVDMMLQELSETLSATRLQVWASFERRGGIAICPYRYLP